MARTWNDPADDQAYVQRANQAWDKILAARRSATPAGAQAVSTMAANYPHMSPGLVVPLAQAGVAPDDPMAQQVALQSAKQNKRKHGFWGAIGDHINPLKYLNGAVGDVLHPIGDVAGSALKWTSRTGTAVLQAPLEIGMGALRDVAAVGGNIAAGAVSGAAVGGAGGALLGGIGAVPGAVGGAVVGGIGGALAEAKGHTIESQGIENPLTQTTLAQSFGEKGLGSGYFAAGTAREAAERAQRRAASVNGHALTPGRYLASTVLEPGTAPYNLVSGLMDAATTWELDPAAKAGHAFGKWRQAEKAFVRADEFARADAGLVEAARKTILPERVAEWLHGADGSKVTQWLADQTDFDTIRRQLGGGKVDVATVLDLTDARTPDEVAAILQPKLGLPGALQHKPKVGTMGLEVKRAYQDSARVFNEMPSGVLDLHDPTGAVEQFDLLQRNAKIPAEAVAANNHAMARALVDGDRTAAKQIFFDQFWGGENGVLAKHNVLPEMRQKLTRQLKDFDRSTLARFIEEDGTQTRVPAMVVGGESHGLPNPGFLAAGTDDVLTFGRDDLRAVRRATSRYSSLVTSRPWAVGTAAIDHVMTDLWKPVQLIRGAWTTRVVGEEQLRMAAAGRSSLFSHPMSHMSWMLADDGKIASVFKKFGVDVEGRLGRGDVDILGERFAEEGSTIVPANADLERELRGAAADFADATNIRQQAEGWLDGTNVLAKHVATYTQDSPEYARVWADKIEQLHRDPVTRRLAAERAADVRKAFADGDLSGLRRTLADQGAALRSDADIDAHISAARKHVVHAAGGVETPSGVTSTLRPGSVTAAGPRGEGAYGRHPGIGAGAESPRPTPPTPPASMEKYRLPDGSYEMPKTPGSLSPAEREYQQQLAAYQQKLAEFQRQDALRQRTQGVYEQYRGQSTGRVPTGGPSYGNAATQPSVMLPERAPRVPGRPTDRRILDAISTGELEGVPIYAKDGSVNEEFVAKLRDVDTGPESIVGQAAESAAGKEGLKRTLDDGVRHMFTAFMAKPSAKLSRSPMFRQSYWSEAENLIYNVTPDAQRAMLDAAEKAGLPARSIERLRGRAALGVGDVKLDEADLLLKGSALDATQKLLYDTAQRGQLSDVMRILMPFAEAQKEVFKVWAKIGVENPTVARRLPQVIGAARGSGIFHKDPTTGEEMFSFPLSGEFTEKLLGMPIPLEGRVQGLNVFGSGIMPGMGPAAQIPAGWLLADKPQYDDLYKMIDPFGASGQEGGGILESQMPSWFQKMRTALNASDSDRTFANSVKDVWAEGVSAGRYRTDSEEAVRDGLASAKSKARWLYVIRGAASLLGAPTSPTPQFMAMDKDQKWIVTEKLADQYQKLLKDDPDTASQKFLGMFGNNAFAFLQAKSYGTTASTPTSTEAADWLTTHRDLVGDYKDVVGLFAPQGEDFDYDQYLRNLKSGATVSLTPEQYAKAANDKLAKMVFYAQKDRFGPTPSKEQRAFLTDLRGMLRETFPGFDEHLPGKPDQETVSNKFIPQIEKAVADPRLAGNQTAQATKVYLAARTKAQQAAEAAGYTTFAQAKGAENLRDWLRQIADLLRKEVPDFGQVMDRVFDREMVDDQAAAVPVATPA